MSIFGEDFEDIWGSNPDDYEDYQEDIEYPDEYEDFSADLFDGRLDIDDHFPAGQDFSADLLDGHLDIDDHFCAGQGLNDPSESEEYLLSEDLLDGSEGFSTDLLDGLLDPYEVQDLACQNEINEYLVCEDLLENLDAAQDLNIPYESEEYGDEYYYGVQDLSDPCESDEHLLFADFEGSAVYDEYCYSTQDIPDDNGERYFFEEFEARANYSGYWRTAQGQQNRILIESEEILCQQLVERLTVADTHPPQMPAVTKPTARKKPAVRSNPPTRENEATGFQTEAGLPCLNAEAAEFVRNGSAERNGDVAENPAAPAAERLSIKKGDAADAAKLILQPD